MITRCLLTVALLSGISCRERPKEVVIDQTRPLTTRDAPPKLHATSSERFRDARPSPVEPGSIPGGWLALPSTQMRLLNYRFGATGTGEVYVSLSSGSITDNVNRWLRQFGRGPMAEAEISGLPRIPVAGTTGVRVQACGTYEPGMGSPPREDAALDGVIAEVGGQILTIKMIGTPTELQDAADQLPAFARDLKWRGAADVSGD